MRSTTDDELHVPMTGPGPNDRVYPATRLAAMVRALVSENVLATDALRGTRMSEEALSTPGARVSCNDMVAVYRNALRLSRDPHFAFHAGLRCNVSTFGMFGLALLSSSTFREAIACALQYRRLAAPLSNFSFREDQGRGAWSLQPVPELIVDAELDKLLVEFELAAGLTLAKNIMGPGFSIAEVHVRSPPPRDALVYSRMSGCKVLFDQNENLLVFDAKWLDRAPQFGDQTTHAEIVGICDALMDEMRLRTGLSGKVREVLMQNVMRRLSLGATASQLHMTARTLRRNLRREQTSFRQLAEDLKMRLAIRYLEETELPVDEVAHLLGFSDVAGFRRAFRRWTHSAPALYRARRRRESVRGVRRHKFPGS